MVTIFVCLMYWQEIRKARIFKAIIPRNLREINLNFKRGVPYSVAAVTVQAGFYTLPELLLAV